MKETFKNVIVLLRDKDVHRNHWPMGVIVNIFPSDGGKIRKAEIRVMKNGCQSSTFVLSVTEMVLLLETSDGECFVHWFKKKIKYICIV